MPVCVRFGHSFLVTWLILPMSSVIGYQVLEFPDLERKKKGADQP